MGADQVADQAREGKAAARRHGWTVVAYDDGSFVVEDGESGPVMTLRQTRQGRWLDARWDDRGAQYVSRDLPRDRSFQGYVKSVSKTVDGLAAIGIRTYATIASAITAKAALWSGES